MGRRRWRQLFTLFTLVVVWIGFATISEGQVRPAPAPTPGGAPAIGAIPEKPSVEPPSATVPSTRPGVFPRLVETLAGPGVQPRATFELHPSITLSEEYTDNFNLSSQNKQENFRTSLGVGLTLLINGARTKGQVTAGIAGTYDTATGDVDADGSSSLGGELVYEVSPRLRLTARDDFTRSDDPLLGDALSLRRERQEFSQNTFSLTSDYLIANIATREYYRLTTFFAEDGEDTISHALGATASVALFEANTVGMGYEFLKSESSGGSDDVTGHAVNAFVSRQLNPQTVVGLSGSYGLRSVDRGSVAMETPETAGDTDYSIGSVSLFARYAVPQRWSVSTSVGYSRVYADVGADASSPTTATVLTYQFARAVLTVTGSVGFSETFAYGENFGVVRTRGVGASLSYPFTPLVSGVGGVFYRQNKFTDVVVSAANRAVVGRTEDVWGGSVGLNVQLLRWLSLALEYTYTTVDASVADRDYAENRARASLTAVF